MCSIKQELICFVFQMDINKNFTTCNIKIDKDKYKKWKTVCTDCYNKKNGNIILKNNHPITVKTLCMNPITTELSL